MGFENGLAMFDFSAVFDTAPHSMLLKKLEMYSFSEETASISKWNDCLQGDLLSLSMGLDMSHSDRSL